MSESRGVDGWSLEKDCLKQIELLEQDLKISQRDYKYEVKHTEEARAENKSLKEENEGLHKFYEKALNERDYWQHNLRSLKEKVADVEGIMQNMAQTSFVCSYKPCGKGWYRMVAKSISKYLGGA